jgi:hypothetical protein
VHDPETRGLLSRKRRFHLEGFISEWISLVSGELR